MTIAELDEEFDKAEKDFNDAFKDASEKLNKTKKYDAPSLTALVKSEGTYAKLIEGYRSNLAASGKIGESKMSIAELEGIKNSEPLTKYVTAMKNAQATVPSQKAIYELVHADMMQEHMNETAPKVPETTSDAAFSISDMADKFCNYDTDECHELTKEAAKKDEQDKNSAYIKILNQKAKSAQLWSVYQKEKAAADAIKAKKAKKDKKKKKSKDEKKDAKKDGDKKDEPKDAKKVEKKEAKKEAKKEEKKEEK